MYKIAESATQLAKFTIFQISKLHFA